MTRKVGPGTRRKGKNIQAPVEEFMKKAKAISAQASVPDARPHLVLAKFPNPEAQVTIGDKTFKARADQMSLLSVFQFLSVSTPKAQPKLFSTGSCGFMASTKASVKRQYCKADLRGPVQVAVEVGGQSLVLQHPPAC